MGKWRSPSCQWYYANEVVLLYVWQPNYTTCPGSIRYAYLCGVHCIQTSVEFIGN